MIYFEALGQDGGLVTMDNPHKCNLSSMTFLSRYIFSESNKLDIFYEVLK